MIIVRNNIIPFKGYKCVNICGILFARKNAVLDEKTMNHEEIHTKQIYETLIIVFYLWYLIEWLIRLIITFNWKKAYRGVAFEQEAYANENDYSYLDSRKHYSWTKYL